MKYGPVGIVGCGRMGVPMLKALSEAGFDVRGFDTRPEAGDQLGPIPFTTDPEEFADGLDIAFTVVRDEAQTEDVLFGEGSLVAHGHELRWIIVSSTLSPRYTRNLRGVVPDRIRLVDAPMAGGQVAAQRKSMTFMLGGSLGDLDHLHPLFNAMGHHFHRMGPFGSGMVAKVLDNLLAASSTAMTRLALNWADAAGLDERALLEIVHSSCGQNWLASGWDDIEFARDGWAPDNAIGLLSKDVLAALDAAPDGASTELPRAVHDAMRALEPRLSEPRPRRPGRAVIRPGATTAPSARWM
ncbi:MAG: NAD(P)-binding domain-containing protein [Pseudomonadota bacterium]